MKKLFCILLTMMTLALPALAEGAPLAEGTPLAEGAPLSESTPFAPYTLTTPEGAALEIKDATHTFVRGTARVVAILIPRVPDADPAEAVLRMMTQFEPDAVLGEDLVLAEGFVGVQAVTTDKYGEDVDQLSIMILSSTGDLLILSGYDMEGDETAVQALLDALLASMTVDGAAILMTE